MGFALGAETTEVSTTISQLLTQQQKINDKVQADLEADKKALQTREQAWQSNLDSLKTLPEEDVTSLEEAEDDKTAANTEVAKLRGELPTIQANLTKQRDSLKELEIKLNDLVQTKPALPEELLKKQLTKLEQNLVLQNKLIESLEKHLALVNQQVEVAEKQLKLTTDWYDKLQNAYLLKPSEKKQKLVEEDQKTLKRKQEALRAAQKDWQTKRTSLETLPTVEFIEALSKASLDKDSATVEVENLRLEQQNTEGDLERQRNNLKELQDTLEVLKKHPAEATESEQIAAQRRQIVEVSNKVVLHKKLLELGSQHFEIVKQRTEVASQYLSEVSKWQADLQRVAQSRKNQDLEGQIQLKMAPHLAHAVDFRKQLESTQDSAQRALLEVQIQGAEGTAQKIVYELKLDNLKEQFSQLQGDSQSQPVNKIPPEKFNHVQALITEFRGLQRLLDNKIGVLKQQQEIIRKQSETLKGNKSLLQADKVLVELRTALENLSPSGQSVLNSLENAYNEYQRRALFSRRELPKDLTEWQSLWKEINAMPDRLGQQLQFTWLDLKHTVEQLDGSHWLLMSVAALLWLGLFIWSRAKLALIFEQLTRISIRSFVAESMLVSLRVLHRNTLLIAVSGVLLLFLWLAQPSQSTLLLLMLLGVAGLGMKLLVNLSWLLLADKNVKLENRSKIYQQLQWTLMVMSVLTVITVWGHIQYEQYDLNMPLRIRELVDSLFMLCLSLTVWPVMRIRSIVLTSLENTLQSYWLWVIRLITLLFPLSILAVAVLGVIGYLNLGWKVAQHASLFLVVLTGWLIAQGLLNDSIILLKNFALRHSKYGLLWTQDIIPLFHKLLGLVLIGTSILIFLWLNSWYTDATMRDVAVRETIEQIFNYSLFQIGNSTVNVGNLLLSIFTLWAVFWFGSWCRRVTYRWIYLGILDLGVRHSLSVFTQYAVVLIGLLVTLRLMGIDLTTLTVFAGALGVGIGFGLQSMANNFISGIILLIERPLCTGDLVNIGGTYEGFVTEIGIRSLTVQTMEHEEVIIPNAELTSRAFTNCTHSNPFKRFSVYVGISYDNDPNIAIAVIKETLAEIAIIQSDPPTQVNLWEFADSSIMFRVDYHINVKEISIVEAKGKVLLAIWYHLKQAGIKIPYPQREVYVRSLSRSSEEVNDDDTMTEFSRACE